MRRRADGAPGARESRKHAASNAPNRAAFGFVVGAWREVKFFFEF